MTTVGVQLQTRSVASPSSCGASAALMRLKNHCSTLWSAINGRNRYANDACTSRISEYPPSVSDRPDSRRYIATPVTTSTVMKRNAVQYTITLADHRAALLRQKLRNRNPVQSF